MKKQVFAIAFLLFVAVLFNYLYRYDNKYKNGPPFGKEGVFAINETNEKELMFLIDDWQFYANRIVTPDEALPPVESTVFIGQYPNFKFIDEDITYGTYHMKISIDSKQDYCMKIPEIFDEYHLFINAREIIHTTGDILPLQPGINEIIIQVVKSNHYYSGLVYPIAIGSSQALLRMQRIHDAFYILFVLLSFMIAIFTFVLRKHEQNKLFQTFGILCFCFGVYCLYPFLHDMSRAKIFYALEDGSFMMVILYLASVCTIMANVAKRYHKMLRILGGSMVLISVIVPSFILPYYQEYSIYYGWLVDAYKILISMYLFYCVGIMVKKHDRYGVALATCSGVFALSLLCNLIFNNLYEPIYTVWQSEYAMLFIILWLFFIINRKFAKTLDEHRHLSNALEEEVVFRTKEMQILLEERKAFFSDVAHDLKAPLTAIHNYTQLIENNNLYVDDETTHYLQSIERKNNELLQRINILNEITKIDKIHDKKQEISINHLMQRVYDDNVPESDALGIYFTMTKLTEDVQVIGVEEKLRIVFENLFYNALAFMPQKGHIKLYGKIQNQHVILCFEDSGEGIAPQHLPFVFDRFYSARKKRSEESGLGLYIVKMIVTEMNGSVWIESEVGLGTKIFIDLPLKK